MPVLRHYVMTAKPGEFDAMRQVLGKLRDFIIASPGSLGVDLLNSETEPEQFFFIERWASTNDRNDAGTQMPAAVMAQLKSLLAAPPAATDLLEVAV